MRRRDDMGDDPGTGVGGWSERREGPSIKLIVAGLIVAMFIVFIAQNGARTHIRFLFLDGQYHLWTLLVVGAGLGFAAGWLVAGARGRRRLQRRAARND